MKKRKELLEKHSYAIWQGKDGKWYTRLPGRILKKRATREEIESLVVLNIGETSLKTQR